MTEYIDKQALLANLEERQAYLVKEWGPRDHYTRGFEEAVDRLRLAEHLQNSGLRMERHGTWSIDGQCSECGEFDVQDPFGSAYCPHCGARMDGGDDNAV